MVEVSMSILNLAWLIPLFPFLAFAVVSIFTYRNRRLSHLLVLGGISIAFVLAQIVFWRAVTLPEGLGEHPFESTLIPWLSAGVERLDLGVYIDPATTVMLLMVPLVCLMIFIYSVGYMNFGTPQVDPRYSRFFAYISLFATGMLGMVVFNNLLAFFLFWEIMGTCSYLLIGFWYEKESAYRAGLKAFLVTKVGDLFFMLGLVLLYSEVGSLAYSEIFKPETLEQLAHTYFLNTQIPLATVIALLLFGGTVGKSAQFPLHVWLPDAMEGPTPVSALIHAATMVSAGVFLVVRTFPLFMAIESGVQLTAMAAIGAFTAAFSSIIAVAQNDIKRVLAFSTISQLGYMVAALGLGATVGAYVAGTFHLITHAFFKALLFLGSGSVIHGVEHGHHHAHGHGEFDPNDMMNMGGLAKRMPATFWTFLAGGLALSGFPLVTAGFWSKDEILTQAWGLNQVVFWTLAASAGLTAFYTMRQICMTFLGQPRTSAAEHAPESVPSMTVPLIVLAVFAVGLGWSGIPEDFPVIGGLIPNWFHHFVGSTEYVAKIAGRLSEAAHGGFTWQPLALGLGFGLGGLLLGWLVYGLKPMRTGEMDRVEAAMRRVRLGWLHEAMANRFYFDELYGWTFVAGSKLLARASAWFDRTVVDGAVNGAGWLGRNVSRLSDWIDTNVVDRLVNWVGRAGQLVSTGLDVIDLKGVDGAVDGIGTAIRFFGRALRPIQTGRVQNYLLLAVVEVLVLVAVFLWWPF
jgi:NADH-quinone oxidoreductase subunit L